MALPRASGMRCTIETPEAERVGLLRYPDIIKMEEKDKIHNIQIGAPRHMMFQGENQEDALLMNASLLGRETKTEGDASITRRLKVIPFSPLWSQSRIQQSTSRATRMTARAVLGPSLGETRIEEKEPFSVTRVGPANNDKHSLGVFCDTDGKSPVYQPCITCKTVCKSICPRCTQPFCNKACSTTYHKSLKEKCQPVLVSVD